ncbi:DNA-binding GntR family transcriptional regulator [Sphingobium xanthum]|uniref:GntR family transcriptional regulator n=1 Tax=Sphingobium xanthum TaxID=1387165 RepID=UPI001C8B1E25|nr:GntR family transcriptional regulator [Sphingobium xanthum]
MLAAERIYGDLKKAILRGEFLHVDYISPRDLNERFGWSLTPLREATRRLAGEGLLFIRPREGYRTFSQNEFDLHARYAMNLEVLKLALKRARSPTLLRGIRDAANQALSEEPDALIAVVEQLFLAIGGAVLSYEYWSTITGLNNRLYTARLAEAYVREDLAAEVHALLESAQSGVHLNLKKNIIAYHRSRMKQVRILADTIEKWAPFK